MEYTVFSDESYITAERFRSIGAFSFPKEREAQIFQQLETILSESNVNEFKWQKLKNAKYRFCAEKLIKFLFETLFEKSARIDVIIWDTHDSRHRIGGRDDNANFARMFFHLMKNLMGRREKDSEWYVYPDENLAIDWETIQECLVSVGKWGQYFEDGLFGDAFSEQFFQIRKFQQVRSTDSLPCHIADFFAGISVFSRRSYTDYVKWHESTKDQLSLFEAVEKPKFSNREEARFHVLRKFIGGCKERRLGVSIKTHQCLCTPDPRNPINFWHYMPQHSYDKAPVRGGEEPYDTCP